MNVNCMVLEIVLKPEIPQEYKKNKFKKKQYNVPIHDIITYL